jgi:hypothetical protein
VSESEIRYVINIAEQRKEDACARAPLHDQKSDLEDQRRVLKGSAPRVGCGGGASNAPWTTAGTGSPLSRFSLGASAFAANRLPRARRPPGSR